METGVVMVIVMMMRGLDGLSFTTQTPPGVGACFIRELLKIDFNREGCEESEGLKTKLHYIIQYIIKQAAACFHVFLHTLRVLCGYFWILPFLIKKPADPDA
jgi:hypothetical protein